MSRNRGEAPQDPRRANRHLLLGLKPLSHAQATRVALRLVDARRDLFRLCESRVTDRLGRPAQADVVLVFVAGTVNALRQQDAHLTKMLDTLREIPRTAQRDLGVVKNGHHLTYKQFTDRVSKTVSVLDAERIGHDHETPVHDHLCWDLTTGEELACPRTCLGKGQPPDDPALHDACPPGCPSRSLLELLFDGLLDATFLITPDVPEGTGTAIDGTDQETWAVRRSYGTLSDVEQDSLEVIDAELKKDPTGDETGMQDTDAGDPAAADSTTPEHVTLPAAPKRPTRGGKPRKDRKSRRTTPLPRVTSSNQSADSKARIRQLTKEAAQHVHNAWAKDLKPRILLDRYDRTFPVPGPTVTGTFRISGLPGSDQFPRLGPDGRLIHSHDAQAREGYRSGKNFQAKETYLGYEVHVAATTTAADDPRPAPVRTRRIRTTGAGNHRGDPATNIIKTLVADGHEIGVDTVDRGYSVTRPDRWSDTARELSGSYVIDLHPHQRGEHPNHHGAVCRDGWYFASSIPDRLLKPAQPKWYAPRSDHDRFQSLCNERRQYAFTGNGSTPGGKRRVKGPALSGALRCVNTPRSMLRAVTVPLTTCKPGDGCSCGSTFVLDENVMATSRQSLLWGTSEWAKAFGRRNLVETDNSLLKTILRRGYTRVIGPDSKAKNFMLLLFLTIALNIHAARRWRVLFQSPNQDGPSELDECDEQLGRTRVADQQQWLRTHLRGARAEPPTGPA